MKLLKTTKHTSFKFQFEVEYLGLSWLMSYDLDYWSDWENGRYDKYIFNGIELSNAPNNALRKTIEAGLEHGHNIDLLDDIEKELGGEKFLDKFWLDNMPDEFK